MIDIHLHILPGIDDGASSLDEAVQMARMAAELGCDTLIATPHQRQDRWPNREPFLLERNHKKLSQAVGESPRIVLGSEVHVHADFLDDLLSPDRAGILTLNASRYLLLEFSRSGLSQNPETVVHEVLLAGYVPILAHPEFIPQFSMNIPLVERLVDRGALLQFTAASLLGDFGRAARSSVRRFLDSGLGHFVASDGHSIQWRPPGLAAAHKALRQGWGEQAADQLLIHNPACVVDDQVIAQ